MGSMEKVKATRELEDIIKEVDYLSLQKQMPSSFALEFITFIKMVNGEGGEEHKSPIIHLDMLDQVAEHDENLFVAFRGSAKTTALHEYMFLYIATYGGIPKFGEVNVAIYVSDTIDNGVKSMRQNLEFRYNKSEFLQKYIPWVKFTDVRWEFKNLEGKSFCVRGFGASTGVRGFKEYGERPTWCHEEGTIIGSDFGTMKVEDYPNRSPSRIEDGLEIKLKGLVTKEVVTSEHMYHAKKLTVKRHKQYLTDSTKSTTSYNWEFAKWVHAEDLNTLTFIGSPIDISIGSLPSIMVRGTDRVFRKVIHPMFNTAEFWWAYGLWYADGFRHSKGITWTVAYTDEHSVGARLIAFLDSVNKPFRRKEGVGCYTIDISDRSLSSWLKETKRGNSIKDFPEEIMLLDPSLQKLILLGYIAGDGYEDYKNNQIRINSVNHTVLLQLGKICERIGIPYHIRNTKLAGKTTFPNGQECKTRHQWEIRLREGVKEVLGFNIFPQSSRGYSHVFIEDGFIWRAIAKVEPVSNRIFIPIHTCDHTYTTSFGLSHNCGFDDLMSDKNAESATITRDIRNIVYKAARQAMHPSKRKIIWTGTPFNKKDPLYSAASSKSWNTRAYPICEEFPCERKDFVGAWEDRFGYDFVRNEYEKLKESGEIASFNQELMLKIISDDDRLVQDSDIVWYKRDDVLTKKSQFNFYITTDFATSEKESADFSVISVWAYNNNGDWMWVDGTVKRQLMDANMDDLFRYVTQYKPLSVGIEISGQQAGFVSWIKTEMPSRNIYFNLASEVGSSKEGLRPTTNKMSRFLAVLPLFKAKKIWLPVEMKDSIQLIEMLDELRNAAMAGFRSRHDDVIDTISMLGLIQAFKPSMPDTMKYNKKSNIWEEFEDTDDFVSNPYIF